MATVSMPKKACAVNPLKMSQPIGGAFAFMGLRGAMPLLHGSQGCTSFGLTLFVRHFKEAVPLQTTAMSEVATVLGGYDNLEQAILNIYNRTKPKLIGICSTGVTETNGDDVDAYIKLIRDKHPQVAKLPLVYVSTPDFKDAFQDGWEKAVTRIVEVLVEPRAVKAPRNPSQVNVLPGCHLTPGDLDELRVMLEDFGLQPSFLPDLAGSLDGHIPDEFTPTTIGGIGVDEVANMGRAGWTIAIGAQMRRAAEAMQAKTGVPFRLFERLCGLIPNDEFIAFLSEISGRPIPPKYRRQRGQLADAMLDAHFHIGGRRLAIGAEPDLLFDLSSMLHEMGAQVEAAVTTTQSAVLKKIRTSEVLVGDLEDLETLAKTRNCDLLITHSHGRQAAARLKIPFYRAGFPMFDRIGAGHQLSVGYRGTRDLIFDIANLVIADREENHQPTPDRWRISALPSKSGRRNGFIEATERSMA
ncbi:MULTISPECIES: nitrogenase iron-molybdenum cofactor biosynthesis protein NifN [unclassified Bradyrhizobium]|uniref:nitrogenase iron-molybdenum cofactor biosynthesis protein NifN n=1 Tax=unclassified Bradyrhizobium TaxID=2631580 RepID=UPI00247ACAF3|nr:MULTISPECIES: nitrogenase iron-molybdenum cofactor biosynthesis protein NifN [unclassified Bradyrhizobium]WGR93602.1 nitrogenase iron-molybdenum cofactor biosynthesis protein NifN [Bradyrhizobium sp. ISRA435]WGR98164.1 nitrogenase iron-molybdenum cofactor biosynthesis protein NifN [Bradyrhizobium sp. ISRA436]WGS05053.1 nitrogenase iron-molybdenum cofactor biosynthesis protein NifN [Bradyrhizobium sp. ISRA437]WGS11938.1 nitrogenase iron-molybdenum cofactor biosynthesis protein NifN [Bradyrhiz